MQINEITAKVGSFSKRFRVGRGPGSGAGKMSGRGHKGAGARAGYGGRVLNEGGALPLFRRVPIRGFSNFKFATRYQAVNIVQLQDAFEDGAVVTVAVMIEAGLADASRGPVKVLGTGTLTKKLDVTADAFSDSAAAKIADAGGKITDLSGRVAARVKEYARAKAKKEADLKAHAEAKAKTAAEKKAKSSKGKAEKPEGKKEPKAEKGEKKPKQPKEKQEKPAADSGSNPAQA